MTTNEVLQERIKHIESNMNEGFASIKKEMSEMKGDISEIKSDMTELKTVVTKIDTKLDERAKANDERFASHDQRINRLGFRFWSMIAGIGLVVVGFILKVISSLPEQASSPSPLPPVEGSQAKNLSPHFSQTSLNQVFWT